MSIRDRVFSIILGVLVLAALGAKGYVFAFHPPEEKFTEFYVLGLEGEAEDYPKVLRVGMEGCVLMGIVNYEYQEMGYRVVVTIDGTKIDEIGPVVLKQDEKWEEEVSFIPQIAGENQKVEFLLYKGDSNQQNCDSLHIWIDVL